MAGAGYDIGASFSYSTSSSAAITAPFSVQGGGGSSGGNTASQLNRGPVGKAQSSSPPPANNFSSYLPWIIGGVAVIGALLLAGFLRR